MPSFEVVTQVPVEPVYETAEAAHPYMGTASWDGKYWVVENNEGDRGTESIWDISDPTNPTELARLTKGDNLGKAPLTDDIGPNSKTPYVFTPGTNDVTVIDIKKRAVVKRIPVGGNAYVGTWRPNKEQLFVPVQNTDTVKVIDYEKQAVTASIPLRPKPYGATAARVRPDKQTMNQMRRLFALLGLASDDEDATYCVGGCYCGTHVK